MSLVRYRYAGTIFVCGRGDNAIRVVCDFGIPTHIRLPNQLIMMSKQRCKDNTKYDKAWVMNGGLDVGLYNRGASRQEFPIAQLCVRKRR